MIGIASRLYERLPPAADGPIDAARRWLLPPLRLRVRVDRFAGRIAGDARATMLVANSNAVTGWLTDRYFMNAPTCDPVGAAAMLGLRGFLSRNGEHDALIVAHVERPAARWLLGENYLCVPESVSTVLELGDSGEPGRSHRRARRNIRLAEKNELTAAVSHRIDEFDAFYDDMYVPFIRARFGPSGFVRNRKALRRRFRRGAILWIRHGGERIAGALVHRDGDVLKWSASGTLGGSAEPVRLGALSALYLHMQRFAHESGLRSVDFGANMPCLDDGVLSHKLSWGARVAPRDESHSDLAVTWRTIGALAALLARTPLIFRDGGGLSGLVRPDVTLPAQKMRSALRRYLEMEGLRRIVIAGDDATASLDDPLRRNPRLWVSPARNPACLRSEARPSGTPA